MSASTKFHLDGIVNECGEWLDDRNIVMAKDQWRRFSLFLTSTLERHFSTLASTLQPPSTSGLTRDGGPGAADLKGELFEDADGSVGFVPPSAIALEASDIEHRRLMARLEAAGDALVMAILDRYEGTPADALQREADAIAVWEALTP
jgi:hypothetical protein